MKHEESFFMLILLNYNEPHKLNHLKQLDENKDLVYTTNFRSMYESIAQGFFHTQSERTKGFPTFNIV
ncbi:MAG: hypothetical protein U9O64_07035 [Campylobacterota bacterium]|nr:hypothetical protein [Campylobacterota bacterium]